MTHACLFLGALVKGLGRNSDCLPCSAAFAPAALKPKLVIAFSKLLMGIHASVSPAAYFRPPELPEGFFVP